jgi:hypothetical protein
VKWTHFVLAVLVAGVVSSFTDWFFGGILFHGRYSVNPEIWRQSPGKSETSAVAWSIVLGFVTSGAFMAAYIVVPTHGYSGALKIAVLCWLIGPVPLLIANALFIKLHPLIVVSHSLGWLAKLVVAALVAGWLLG